MLQPSRGGNYGKADGGEKRKRHEEMDNQGTGERMAKKDVSRDYDLMDDVTPVFRRNSKQKSCNTRPKEAECGRAKQRKHKGTGTKNGN